VSGDATGEPLSPAWILDALPDPVIVVDTSFRLIAANVAALDRFGWDPARVVGAACDGLVHPDDHAQAVAALRSVQAKAIGSPVELRVRDADGRFGHFEARGRSSDQHVVVVLREVTDRRRWEIAAGSSSLLQAVLDHAPAATILLDADGCVRGTTRAMSTILGIDAEEVLGIPLDALAAHEDRATVSAELELVISAGGTRSFEASFRAEGGGVVPMNLTVVNLLDDAAIGGLLVTAFDASALRDAHRRLTHVATHDDLTGLPNRGLLHQRLADALQAAGHRETPLTVLSCAVDGLRDLNEAHGVRGGDAVLVEVARRLRAIVRPSDTVGRIGAGRFALILEGRDARTPGAVGERIARAMEAPIVVPTGEAVVVSVSVGSAAAGTLPFEIDTDALLAAADTAVDACHRRRVTTDRASADEILAVQAHRLLGRIAMVGGALETLLESEHLLDPDQRRGLLSAGAAAARTLGDDLGTLARGISVSLGG